MVGDAIPGLVVLGSIKNKQTNTQTNKTTTKNRMASGNGKRWDKGLSVSSV